MIFSKVKELENKIKDLEIQREEDKRLYWKLNDRLWDFIDFLGYQLDEPPATKNYFKKKYK